MLKEAIQIIRELFTGELIDWKGEYFEVDSARIWDLPETPVPSPPRCPAIARSTCSRRYPTT